MSRLPPVFLLCSLLLSGCASHGEPSRYTPPSRDFTRSEEQRHAHEQFLVYDPIERANRRIYKFNAKFDQYLFLPVVDAYEFAVPDYVDDRISSFFSNIGEFRNATNAALQAKPVRAATGVGRFAINSTVGLLGFYDPATHIGLTQKKEDFGQTLGYWGVSPGAYLILPVLGPSNLRDTAGMVVDMLAFSFVVPDSVKDKAAYKIVQYGVRPVHTRVHTDFRYHETGSPFEYELVRYVITEGRRLAVAD